MRNEFRLDLDFIPFNSKKNLKKKEEPITYELRLATNPQHNDLKDERETYSLRNKTCFQSMATGT